MRPLSFLALFVLVSLAVVELAAAQGEAGSDEENLCIIFFTPSNSFGTVEIRVDLILTEEDRRNITRELDADGNGAITAQEISAYENASYEDVERFEELGEKKLLRNNQPPTNVTIWRDLERFEGPAEPVPNGTVAEVRVYQFAPPPRLVSSWEFRGGAGAYVIEEPVVETVVFRAPEGWLVWEVDGVKYAKPEVVRKEFSIRQSFSVRFVPEDYDPANPEPADSPWDRLLAPGFGGEVAILSIATILGIGHFLAQRKR